MKDYVELDRRFVPFDANAAAGERDNLSHFLSSRFGSKNWNDILSNRCTVIIAEALNGKTTEMRQRTLALRKAGTPAFFCRLDFLANVRFEQAIEIGTPREFEDWKATDARGHFFLDSVDEARLASPQDFERAILNFVDAIEPYKDRVAIFISTRPHAWQAYADRAMLERRLALGPASDDSQPAENSDELMGEEIAEATSNPPNSGKLPPIVILQMAPFNKEQIRTFANERQVADVDAFLEEVEHADADVFATTPADLLGLIFRWKKHQRIGRYSEVVDDNIALKLSETNPKHQRAATIAPDRARAGAMALTAGLTLTKATSILLPDQPVDEALRGSALDPNEVLNGWTPSEVQTLLGRGLFDESLYGTVRFHHQTAREYLAAQWFEQLLKSRKNRRTIEQLFFAAPYGTQPIVVIPSMKPIVGWLAIWDQRIRDKAKQIDPKVLLEFGDASALDVGTRETLLKGFAARYKDRKNTPISLDAREVRRLADPRLASTICLLLESHREHDGVRNLLLRVTREGKVRDCGDVASSFALDLKMDGYTRSLAVEAVGAAGREERKRQVARRLVAEASTLDRVVAAAAIEAFWPNAMSDADVHKLFARAPSASKHSVDPLASRLGLFAQQIPRGDRLVEMLCATVSLLTEPPLHSKQIPISVRHDWLLPFAWSLAKQTVGATASNDFDTAVLTAISFSQQADRLNRYMGEIDKEATTLIQSNRALWHSLFWHQIGEERLRSERPVNDWWMAIRRPAMMLLEESDSERFFEDINSRPLLDDKLVALSALMTIYNRAGKPAALLERIKVAAAGNKQLEDAAGSYLSPPPASKDLQKAQREFDALEKQRKARSIRIKKARSGWIKQLRKNPTQVGDLGIAAEGKVWNSTRWLFDELRKKRNRSTTSWTIADWEILKPEFGSEVAEQFRNFCRSFWRLHKPALRSETGIDTNSTPWAVIIGLSGLAMEARADPDWSNSLTDDEVVLATRYAFWELNNLPSWLTSLHQARPLVVKQVILDEIGWQFRQSDPKIASHYVLYRLRWTAKELGQALRDDLIGLVGANSGADATALAEALTIILRDPSPLPTSFKRLAAKQAVSAAPERRTLWISVLLCVDANRGIAALEEWVAAGADNSEKEKRITDLLENIWGDRVLHSLDSQHRDFMNVEALTRLLRLTYANVRHENDISHDDVYSPGPRDRAQRAREHLLQLLSDISGEPTFSALHGLATLHKGDFADHVLNMAERRAEADVEHEPWKASDVASFWEEAERDPAAQKELFEIGMSRLDDLKLEIEEGDESEATLLRKVENEIELRRALANRLRNMAQGKYTTGSEEEFADITRSDIRLHNPHVEARIPIEVKIAGKWQASVLGERLKNQLVGQYMREARYGIFLVVNRGAKGDLQTWNPSGKRVGFAQLLEWLSGRAQALRVKSANIDGLEVVGIDLLKRESSRRQQADARKRPARRRLGITKRTHKRRRGD